GSHVPNPHKIIATKGCEGLSPFHKCYGLPRPRAVTRQPVDFLAAGHVPQADGIVKAPRNEELPVRREDEPLNEEVVRQLFLLPTGRQVPDADRAVKAAGNCPPLRREQDAADFRAVAHFPAADSLTGLEIE